MAMSFNPWRLAPLAGLMLIGGCDTVHASGSTDPGFGETARYNAALQIIDPDPRVAEGAMEPGSHGAVGAAAAKRYRTNTVKQIQVIDTTGGTTGSSGPRG